VNGETSASENITLTILQVTWECPSAQLSSMLRRRMGTSQLHASGHWLGGWVGLRDGLVAVANIEIPSHHQ